MSREKLIVLAYLLGCDYCDGIRGVGVVNALEILTAFEDLAEIKSILFNWGKMRDELNDFRMKNASNKIKAFIEKHKNYKKHWIFPEDFARPDVKKAFL